MTELVGWLGILQLYFTVLLTRLADIQIHIMVTLMFLTETSCYLQILFLTETSLLVPHLDRSSCCFTETGLLVLSLRQVYLFPD